MSSIFFGQQDWLGGGVPKRPECSYKCVKGRIKTGRGQCDACVLFLLPEPPQTKRSKTHCTEKMHQMTVYHFRFAQNKTNILACG